MDKVFADGLRFERPREGAPDFVKGRISVQVEEFTKFLEKHKSEKGWVNLDLLVSKKEGNPLYFQLDNWKPEVKKEVGYPEEINAGDIPF